MTPFITVVICTRNRAHRLAETCTRLSRLDYPADRWEIVVVDNDSHDATADIIAEFSRKAAVPVRSVFETSVGLSHARNRGIREARGEVIAFVDDDAVPVEGWLRAVAEAIVGWKADVVGGPVDLAFESAPPDWFSRRYYPFLGAFDQGTRPLRLTYAEYPRGTNIAFRRKTFEQVGGFSKDLGRAGKSLLSCEEIEICVRAERAGLNILYHPEARVVHHVASDRLSPAWLVRRYFAQGRSEAILEMVHGGLRVAVPGAGRLMRHWFGAILRDRFSPVGLSTRCHGAALFGYCLGVGRTALRLRKRSGPSAENDPKWLPHRQPALELEVAAGTEAAAGRNPVQHPVEGGIRRASIAWTVNGRGEEAESVGGPPVVSVIIPTKNGGETLQRCLTSISSQKIPHPYEVLCVDSASDRESQAIMKAFPVRIVSIDPRDFNHGLTRDLGARMSRGRVLVFINQDAVPCDEHWLHKLTEPLLSADPPAAVQGGVREVPQRDQRFYWNSCGKRFYFTSESRTWIARHGGIGFATGNAAIRREIWERHPFGWAPIMEDKKWQGEVIRAGYEIGLRADAAVYHSHNYGMRTLVRRCMSEGYGWRFIGEDYGLRKTLRDMARLSVYGDLARGLLRGEIVSAAELLFPWVRPLFLYYGNRWCNGVRL